jgi:hypothetical protein
LIPKYYTETTKKIILRKELATQSSVKYYQNTNRHFKTVRELFLRLASTQSDLTTPGDSMQRTAEEKVALCRCNTDAVLRAAVTVVFASLKSYIPQKMKLKAWRRTKFCAKYEGAHKEQMDPQNFR